VTAALFLLILFVVVPALAIRHGAESRTGFASPIDWRRIDS
jgi:hypothetical protein